MADPREMRVEGGLMTQFDGSWIFKEILMDPFDNDLFSVLASQLNERPLHGRRSPFLWTKERVEKALGLPSETISLENHAIETAVQNVFGVPLKIKRLRHDEFHVGGWNRDEFDGGGSLFIGRLGNAFVGYCDNNIFFHRGGHVMDQWQKSYLLEKLVALFLCREGVEEHILEMNSNGTMGDDLLPGVVVVPDGVRPRGNQGRERAEAWVQRLDQVIRCMASVFYKREDTMKMLLLGLLSGKSVHLHGPHGVAKTACANRLFAFFAAENPDSKFEITLSKSTLPEEVFGPVSIQGLKSDVFERKTEGYLPSASLAFIDEVWNASSAILKGFLNILNEKIFINGGKKVTVPMEMFVTASTEEPGVGLAPLYDRFILRVDIQRFKTEEDYTNLLAYQPPDAAVSEDLMVDPEILRVIQEESRKVQPSQMVLRILKQLPLELRKQGIDISERRLLNLLAVLQVAAWTRSVFYKLGGQPKILLEDLPIMQYVICPALSDFPAVRQVFESLLKLALKKFPNECVEDNESILRLSEQRDLFLPWIARPEKIDFDDRLFEHIIYDNLLKK
uniref:MoxR domain-containing protein n=1 Tax=Paramoeba aestuarina TaxID=180227 RepID=A0A7S4PJI1_9EUKA|eukprot:CAMPEP_0201540702 /NCGR_PEP_ID=MMETSP0161_2-20130828/71083_1 /ASSEMBLY_ACC=CAM_ASM_000251 /TAXON_ID=180227 /ORGANISM="Neoparamoeba aestuarina, Strain SoJaBio B1-5/56/2" /LENGTH=562 /DNA_ID=CAMNT_0047948187 /DNA_START=945 /DNA_END=2633 /DNA_ORIENTATION=-